MLFRFCLLLLGFCAGSVFAQGPLTPPAGTPAPTMKTLQQAEPRTDINLLPGDATAVAIITGPGSYYLTADLAGVAGKDTIRIATAGRVTIDLNGFALTNTGADRSAITVPAANDSIVIRNGTILCGGGTSTKAVGGTGTRVSCENLEIIGNTGTVVLSLGDDARVTRCRIAQGGIVAGLRSVLRDSSLQGTTEMTITLGNEAQVSAVQYVASRGLLTVGARSLLADCQVNIQTGPPTIFSNAAVVQTGLGCVVRHCTITGGSTEGHALAVGSNSLVSGCRISSVFRDGIIASTIPNVTVESCVVQGNGRDAINLGPNARVRDCTVAGSGAEGIEVGENSVVTDCTVSAAGGSGGIVSLGENVSVSRCAVKGITSGAGISLFSGSITDCTVSGTTNGAGIQVTQRSTVSRNRSENNGVVTTNPRAGLRVIGPNNQIENNQLVNNAGFGIEITGAPAIGNLVIGNHAFGNSGGASQFSIAAGNAVGAIVPVANTATDTHPSANYVP
jgi:parallel beta-helix repeat protein